LLVRTRQPRTDDLLHVLPSGIQLLACFQPIPICTRDVEHLGNLLLAGLLNEVPLDGCDGSDLAWIAINSNKIARAT
jgi:hypothetical protein